MTTRAVVPMVPIWRRRGLLTELLSGCSHYGWPSYEAVRISRAPITSIQALVARSDASRDSPMSGWDIKLLRTSISLPHLWEERLSQKMQGNGAIEFGASRPDSNRGPFP
jgi:hypothetical protein